MAAVDSDSGESVCEETSEGLIPEQERDIDLETVSGVASIQKDTPLSLRNVHSLASPSDSDDGLNSHGSPSLVNGEISKNVR